MNPTCRHYAKVHKVLSSDDYLSEQLGTKIVSVSKPSGAVERFPEPVLAITCYMMANKYDVLTASQKEIKAEAMKVLNGGYQKHLPAPESGAVRTRGRATGDKAAESDAVAPVRRRGRPPKAAAPESQAGSEAVAAPAKRRGRPPRAAVQEPTSVTAPVTSAPAKAGRGRKPATSSTVFTHGQPSIFLGIASNAVVIQTMLDKHDFFVGHEERKNLIKQLLAAISKAAADHDAEKANKED